MRTSTRFGGWLAAMLTGAAVAAQPGAVAPSASLPAATSAANAPLPWPARLAVESGLKPETVARMGPGWSPMGTIEPVKPPVMSLHLGTWESKLAAKGQQEDWSVLEPRLVHKADGLQPRFEKAGGFVYVASDEEPTGAASNRAALMFRFISARPAPIEPGAKPGLTVERTWFALYDPLPPKTQPGDPVVTEPTSTRGLVVVMPGMFGTPVDQIVGLIRKLRQDGYVVLRMMSQPSRFTERVTYPLPVEGDMSGSIPSIAADLTDRAAEAAYAVESAVLYAQQERPVLRTLPRAAVGMSGGAMLLPVVLARDPGGWAGAVSIAGGVDYLRILTTSNYSNWIDAVKVQWIAAAGGPADAAVAGPERLEELAKLYRRAAPLDSANLAPMVKSIPWLLLHATSDKAVPAGTGDELWELLGKPERITVKGGHEWIFMTLGGRYNAIADWLNRRIPAQTEPVR